MQAAEVFDRRSSAAIAAWAHRPGDDTFDTVEGLMEHTAKMFESSRVSDAAIEHLKVGTPGYSMRPGQDNLYLIKDDAKAARFTNFSFNQFCQTIGARAGEWRKYPASLAQVPLTWKAENCDRKDVKLLVRLDEENLYECRAVNSPTYGRIWNHELAVAVHNHVDPDVWTVPSRETSFHIHTGFITTNDRKAFVFLVNEGNPIMMPGVDKPLYRGFYAWNSEVGDGTCGIAEFLFNQACANRVIVGLSEFKELCIRHTSGAPDRWVKDAVPSLDEYVNTSTEKIVERIAKSKEKNVAKDEKGALEWMQSRGFTKVFSKAAIDSAREEERGADPKYSPFSVWNLIQGASAEAREKRNNDDRVALEVQAGRLMKAAF